MVMAAILGLAGYFWMLSSLYLTATHSSEDDLAFEDLPYDTLSFFSLQARLIYQFKDYQIAYAEVES